MDREADTEEVILDRSNQLPAGRAAQGDTKSTHRGPGGGGRQRPRTVGAGAAVARL